MKVIIVKSIREYHFKVDDSISDVGDALSHVKNGFADWDREYYTVEERDDS